MISKSCEYAIKAVVYLATTSKNESLANLKEVSKGINSPVSFTSKILQKLVKQEIVVSIQGKYGGFAANKNKITQLSIWDVVLAIDGNTFEKRCFIGLDQCSGENPCALHFEYLKVRQPLINFMKSTLISTVEQNVLNGIGVLKK